MSDNTAFGFGQFVPGFDFLQTLVQSAAKGGVPTAGASAAGLPDWSKWIAPTLQPEEIDKRIGELRTVHFWLEQNARALAATIQALEVQKMTLATLRQMNVQAADLAGAFGLGAGGGSAGKAAGPTAGPYDDMFTARPAAAPASAASAASALVFAKPAEAPATPPAASPRAADAAQADDPTAKGQGAVPDPMQWWNALTGQFQQIAAAALQDAARHAQSAPGAQVAEAARQAFDTAGRMAAQTSDSAAPGAPEKGAADTRPASENTEKPSQKPAVPVRRRG